VSKVEEAIAAHWGPKCEPECPVCQAWAELDEQAEPAMTWFEPIDAYVCVVAVLASLVVYYDVFSWRIIAP
jgi:hypothetical protein